MPMIARTVAPLLTSNLFRTFGWYAQPRNLAQRPWLIAALASWGITLTAFVPIAWLYMGEPVRLDYRWVARCICGAV